ncbi:invasion associated locus B family protein [Mangrovicoccus algicola]|nr:invasion associated locus B family protein [Mangrovicoccus algicola]
MAQMADNPVGAKTDWTIYVEDDPRQCWVVSPPQAGKSTATREGRPVAVQRGDIFLFVSFWPKDANGGGKGEVSFMGGYDFAEGEPVVLEIGDSKFDLFADGDVAWATSAEQDSQIARAMKAGAEAKVTGVSERSGTTTQDTFSLMGFTAAFEDAERRCAQ